MSVHIYKRLGHTKQHITHMCFILCVHMFPKYHFAIHGYHLFLQKTNLLIQHNICAKTIRNRSTCSGPVCTSSESPGDLLFS